MRKLSPQEGIVGLALCAFDADGDQDASEWEALALRVLEVADFESLTEHDLREMLPPLAERRAQTGTDAFVRDCAAAVPPERRRQAYAVALRVSAADGRIVGNERGYLTMLADRLGVPPQG